MCGPGAAKRSRRGCCSAIDGQPRRLQTQKRGIACSYRGRPGPVAQPSPINPRPNFAASLGSGLPPAIITCKSIHSWIQLSRVKKQL
jgi:hypothetical protein